MTSFTRFAICILGVGLALPPRLRAQEVTVDELVAIAIEQAPQLQAARTEVDMSAGRVTQAALRPNPALVTNQELGSGNTVTTKVGMEWPLDLFRRPARVASARSAVEVTSVSVRDYERLLVSAVREQAGRLLAARRTLAVTSEVSVAARRTRELLEQRVIEGGVRQIDVDLAVVEALRFEADVALAAGEVDAAMIELKALVGFAPDAPFALRGSLEALVRPPVEPELAPEAAIDARPDILEEVARIALADAHAEEARREGRLDVTLTATYTRMQFGYPQLGLDQRGIPVPIQGIFHTVTVGAKVMLPMFDRNQGTLATAQAERDRAEATLAARRLAARAEIDAAVVREREARRAVDLYATNTRELARRKVDVVLEAYDLGRFRLEDVLVEQRRYLDVEAGYTAVLARAYEARTDLSLALGEMP